MAAKPFLLLMLTIVIAMPMSHVTVNAADLIEQKDQKVIIKNKIPPITSKINEVELVGGEQKIIYMMIKDAKRKLRVGLIGQIYKDRAQTHLIGKFKVDSIANNYVKGIVIELNNTIGSAANVLIEIDPCCYFK